MLSTKYLCSGLLGFIIPLFEYLLIIAFHSAQFRQTLFTQLSSDKHFSLSTVQTNNFLSDIFLEKLKKKKICMKDIKWT